MSLELLNLSNPKLESTREAYRVSLPYAFTNLITISALHFPKGWAFISHTQVCMMLEPHASQWINFQSCSRHVEHYGISGVVKCLDWTEAYHVSRSIHQSMASIGNSSFNHVTLLLVVRIIIINICQNGLIWIITLLCIILMRLRYWPLSQCIN